MADPKRRLAVALFGVLAVLVLVFFITSGRERIRTIENQVSGESAPAGEGPAGPPLRTATLFFLNESDGLFVGEEREIPANPSLAREAESVLSELIKGPKGDLVAPLPAETGIGRVFVTKDGTAYVDFTADIVEKHPSGTEAETATVFSVVNTLTFNFKAIKKVFLLVDGEERETLAGHISLDRAFLPDYSLIAKR